MMEPKSDIIKKIAKYRHLILILGDTSISHPVRKSLILHGPTGLVDSVCHCVNHVIGGAVNVGESDLDQLRRHKSYLHKLIKKGSVRQKRKTVAGKGFKEVLPRAIELFFKDHDEKHHHKTVGASMNSHIVLLGTILLMPTK